MTAVWISFAFVLGFVAWHVGLPPLVGFLMAGFILHAFGVQGGEILLLIAHAGVLLLLFSVGLKLRLKRLARPEVLAGSLLHMLLTGLVMGAALHWAFRLPPGCSRAIANCGPFMVARPSASWWCRTSSPSPFSARWAAARPLGHSRSWPCRCCGPCCTASWNGAVTANCWCCMGSCLHSCSAAPHSNGWG